MTAAAAAPRRVTIAPDLASWRAAARGLLGAQVSPSHITWDDGGAQSSLFTAAWEPPPGTAAGAARVPRDFLALAERVACHADPARWDALYRALWRVTRGERDLLQNAVDADVARLRTLEKEVRREEHRMQAYVRFRRVHVDGEEHWVAWYAPDHPVVPLVAPFFARRFPDMRWTILGPEASVSWDGSTLRTGAGAPRAAAPRDDEVDDLFRAYYGASYNPARTNLDAMRKHMPASRWAELPELRDVHALLALAPARVTAMQEAAVAPPSASTPLAASAPDLDALVAAMRGCTACPIHARATQVVVGRGPREATLLVVGEQPGDEEDLAGEPFVGPAGRVFEEGIRAAGIDRSAIFVTNAVKHFKWTPAPRGKRRIHSRASPAEIQACRGWLDAEIRLVKPSMILCLGATAARAFLGPKFSVTRDRGRVFPTPWARWWMATWHPSALLRMPDEAARERAGTEFIADLRTTAAALADHQLHRDAT